MEHRICSVEVICEAHAWAGLNAGVNQVEIIVAQAQIESQIANWREVVLHIGACLPAIQSAGESREDIRIAAAVKEEVFVLPQADEIHSILKKLPPQDMREITRDAQGERRRRPLRKWR